MPLALAAASMLQDQLAGCYMYRDTCMVLLEACNTKQEHSSNKHMGMTTPNILKEYFSSGVFENVIVIVRANKYSVTM